MAELRIGVWGRQLGSLVGMTLAGPGGALLGNIAGGFVESIFPGAADVIKGVISNLTIDAVQKTGKMLIDKLDPEERRKVNHDLQRIFRLALHQSLIDIGGEVTFQKEWKAVLREVPIGVCYFSTPEGNTLIRGKNPLANQIIDFLHQLRDSIDTEKILPLVPIKDKPTADVRSYLQVELSWEMNQLFCQQVLGDFFSQYVLLFAERPDFKQHLERYLLDRTLIHLGENLKADTPAWRAFNRLLLEGLASEVKHLTTGQKEVLERLDLLLDKDSPAPLAQWSEGIATLIVSVGKLEKHLDDRLETVLAQAVAQHSEILVRMDRLKVVSGRIETKVDRVLKFLEDGRYEIEGAAPVYTRLPPEPGEAPYKGLLYYQTDEAELYFGREELTAKLVNRLYQQRVLAIVGASGSGKSSLVRAGVMAALKRGEALVDGSLPPLGSASWSMVTLTPTAHPLEALAAALTQKDKRASAMEAFLTDLRVNPHSLDWFVRKLLVSGPKKKRSERLLLVVDQFEEIFTACKDAEERKAFIDNLITAAMAEGPLVLIMVLRADFYDQSVQFEQLRIILEQYQAIIGPMSREELKRAIEEPARKGKWQFESGLVDLILHDVGADPGRKPEPGALPLLSHALLEAWKQRHGRMITLESYGESGGVRKAIAKTAESVYCQQLTPEQQPIARSIFLRLTELGEGTQDTRRRAVVSEFILNPEKQNQVELVLKVLTDARLVTADANSVEVAHEALIREWPTLRSWLDENRQALRVQHNLTEAVLEWHRFGKDAELLYRGARLAEALECLDVHTGEANSLEAEFLEASRLNEQRQAEEHEAQRQRELEQARKLANTQRQWVLSLALGLLLALILAGVALAFSQRAVAERERAESALIEADTQHRLALAHMWTMQGQMFFDLSAQGLFLNAVYAIEALQLSPSLEAKSSLMKTLELMPHLISSTEINIYARHIALSKDGRWIVSGDDLGVVRVWETTREGEVTHMKHDGSSVTAVAFSPDGHWVVSGSGDNTARVWDATNGVEISRITHSDFVTEVAFSPDGRWVVSGSRDGTARVWDASSGEEVSRMTHGDFVTEVAFSPDGRLVASGDLGRTLRVWEAATGEEVSRMRLEEHLGSISFSSDGRWVVACGDVTVQVWEAATGMEVSHMKHDYPVSVVAFSPDGLWVASGTYDGKVQVWDAAKGVEVSRMAHDEAVSDITFSPDGRWVVSGSDDGTVRVWEASSGKELSRMIHGEPVHIVAFSTDGRQVVSIGISRARVWEAVSGAEVACMTHDAGVTAIAFSPDGRWVVSGSRDGTARVWEASSGEEVSRMTHGDFVTEVAFSPDGRWVVSGSGDGTARVWEASSGEEVSRMTHGDFVTEVAFSPDGRWVVSGSGDGKVRVWEASSGEEVSRMTHDEGVTAIAFSPDGRLVVSSSRDGKMQVWEAATGEMIANLIHKDQTNTAPINPDGRWVVSRSNNTVQVRDAASGVVDAIFYISSSNSFVTNIAFSPDGRWIVSRSDDGTARVWEVVSGMEVTLIWHDYVVTNVAFSPDGLWVLSGSWDGTVRVWEAVSGKEVAHMTHDEGVTAVAFSPDGHWVVSGGYDNTARVWETASGKGMVRMTYDAPVYNVAFSPDGRWVVSGSEDGTARVWMWHVEDLIAEACRRLPRNLTEAEWAQYFPSEAYRLTCPELGVP